MNAAAELQLETYLRSLRECLGSMAIAEREDIIREISVHIRESAEEGTNVGAILARLGRPEDLAAQYTDDVIVRRASHSVSPVTILRATLHIGRRGAEGTILFFVAIFGYAAGLGFVITALLKSFFPRETGLWVGPHTFDFGFYTPAHQAHEVLGWLYIPITLFLGGFFLWLTTFGMRWLIAKMGLRKHPRLAGAAAQGHVVLSM
jgi:HAAS